MPVHLIGQRKLVTCLVAYMSVLMSQCCPRVPLAVQLVVFFLNFNLLHCCWFRNLHLLALCSLFAVAVRTSLVAALALALLLAVHCCLCTVYHKLSVIRSDSQWSFPLHGINTNSFRILKWCPLVVPCKLLQRAAAVAAVRLGASPPALLSLARVASLQRAWRALEKSSQTLLWSCMNLHVIESTWCRGILFTLPVGQCRP